MAVNINKSISKGLQVSSEVDQTSRVRPVIKIKSPISPQGFKIINVEDYDKVNMTKISDAFTQPLNAINVTQDVSKLDQFNTSYISSSEGGADNDFKKMKKDELKDYAKVNEIDIADAVSVSEIRAAIIEFVEEMEE